MIIQCPHCRTKNRIPPERAGQTGKCGKCGGALQVPAFPRAPVEVDSEAAFDELLGRYSVSVLVDFYSRTCGPCAALAPVLERLVASRASQLVVAKVSVDNNPPLAVRFGVRGVPTLIVFRDGKELARLTGAPPETELAEWVGQFL